MDDLISRKWLKTAIHNFFYGLRHIPEEDDIQAYIDAAPSVEPQSMIHGCKDCKQNNVDNYQMKEGEYVEEGEKWVNLAEELIPIMDEEEGEDNV